MTSLTSELKPPSVREEIVSSGWKPRYKTVFAACLLAMFAFICYCPSLSCGMVSDDYGYFAYVLNWLQTQPLHLLQNCTGPLLESNLRELHYRPFLLLVPYLLDCIMWSANPVGYHCTNIIINCINTVLVFFITRKLVGVFAKQETLTIPFLSGALFAVHPLHAEVVSWISGRSDGMCTLLYLGSLLSFLASLGGSPRLRATSLCLGFASMLTKENGVTLPAVLTWYCLCSNFGSVPWRQCLVTALKTTRTYWILLLLYLGIRAITLGTIFGGYSGLTSNLIESSWKEIFSWHAYQGVFIPVPWEMAQETTFYVVALQYLSLALLITGLCRLAVGKLDRQYLRMSAFVLGWILISLSIVARVWTVVPGLAGSRHFYLVSVPFCMLMMFAIIPDSSKLQLSKLFRILAISLVAFYCAVMSVVTFDQHRMWFELGKSSTVLQNSVISYYRSRPLLERIIVLNVPASLKHINYYAHFLVFKGLFAKPFCSPDLTEQIASLQPYFFDRNLLNKSALDRALTESSGTAVLFWDVDEGKLKPVSPAGKSQRTAMRSIAHIREIAKMPSIRRYEIRPSDPTMTKGDIDCIELLIRCVPLNQKSLSGQPKIMLSWNSDNDTLSDKPVAGSLLIDSQEDGTLALCRTDEVTQAKSVIAHLDSDGRQQAYRFHLSELSSWVLKGNLTDMRITTWSKGYRVEMRSAHFLNLAGEIPTLSANSSRCVRNQDGTFSPVGDSELVLDYDASKIEGASQVVAEISHPDRFWEYFTPSFRQRKLDLLCLKSLVLSGVKGDLRVSLNVFPRPADYQLRVAALDSHGQLIGYVSDPVTIHIQPSKAE